MIKMLHTKQNMALAEQEADEIINGMTPDDFAINDRNELAQIIINRIQLQRAAGNQVCIIGYAGALVIEWVLVPLASTTTSYNDNK